MNKNSPSILFGRYCFISKIFEYVSDHVYYPEVKGLRHFLALKSQGLGVKKGVNNPEVVATGSVMFPTIVRPFIDAVYYLTKSLFHLAMTPPWFIPRSLHLQHWYVPSSYEYVGAKVRFNCSSLNLFVLRVSLTSAI